MVAEIALDYINYDLILHVPQTCVLKVTNQHHTKGVKSWVLLYVVFVRLVNYVVYTAVCITNVL